MNRIWSIAAMIVVAVFVAPVAAQPTGPDDSDQQVQAPNDRQRGDSGAQIDSARGDSQEMTPQAPRKQQRQEPCYDRDGNQIRCPH